MDTNELNVFNQCNDIFVVAVSLDSVCNIVNLKNLQKLYIFLEENILDLVIRKA